MSNAVVAGLKPIVVGDPTQYARRRCCAALPLAKPPRRGETRVTRASSTGEALQLRRPEQGRNRPR